MKQLRLGEMEQKFADLIWEKEPIPLRELIKLCEQAFNWKRTTTYTMLKRLCEREIFENKESMIFALISKEEFHTMQGEQLIKENFGGSLPQFLAAFTRRKKLNKKEVEELQKLIEEYQEEE